MCLKHALILQNKFSLNFFYKHFQNYLLSLFSRVCNFDEKEG